MQYNSEIKETQPSTMFTFTTTECDHKTFTYRKARVDFYLFELVMLYRVCHDCNKLIRDHKRWKFRLQ